MVQIVFHAEGNNDQLFVQKFQRCSNMCVNGTMVSCNEGNLSHYVSLFYNKHSYLPEGMLL